MSTREQFVATVTSNDAICREHFRLVFQVEGFPATEPGQFIQIACRDLQTDHTDERVIEWEPGKPPSIQGTELTVPVAFLRRPFSLAGRRDGATGAELEIIHRVVGIGTDWLARLAVGDKVDILGPLGNRFRLPEPDQTAVLVGGGVGIPPMLYLAQSLRDRSAVAFCGATTRDLLALTISADADPAGLEPRACIREFAECGIDSVITTDDGTYGYRGFVTQALEQWLDKARAGKPPGATVIYTCGPEPMMKRVADIALRRGISCQIAVERAMACGMGTCQSCCIRVKKPDPARPPLPGKDWSWRLACTDGPIFTAAELLW